MLAIVMLTTSACSPFQGFSHRHDAGDESSQSELDGSIGDSGFADANSQPAADGGKDLEDGAAAMHSDAAMSTDASTDSGDSPLDASDSPSDADVDHDAEQVTDLDAALDADVDTGTPPYVTDSGTPLPATLTASPMGTLNFNVVESGTTSPVQTWTITNNSENASSVPELTSSGASTQFAITNHCTQPIVAGGQCTIDFKFKPTGGGNQSAKFDLGVVGGGVSIMTKGNAAWRLSISKTGTAAAKGTVHGDTVVDCGSTCAALYGTGSTVKLTAITHNGGDAYFRGWTGDCAYARSSRTCTVIMSKARSVQAIFDTIDHNLAFVSSGLYPSNLGIDGYDAACNVLASSIGVNDLDEQGFVAFVAASADPMVLGSVPNLPTDRMGNARGFMRMDGHSISDTRQNLISATYKFWNAVELDEQGNRPFDDYAVVLTGMDGTGGATGDCWGWSSSESTDVLAVGSRVGGPKEWIANSFSACSATSDYRIYCFQRTKTTALDTPSFQIKTPTKRIFMTDAPFVIGGGRTAADALCNSVGEKPAGAGTFVALLSTQTQAAAARLVDATTYVTPDLQLIALGSALKDGGPLTTGIWQRGDKSFANFFEPGQWGGVWTGSDKLTTVGTTASTCNDWYSSSASSTAFAGRASTMQNGVFWYWFNPKCDSPDTRLYCVEQ